MVHHKNNDCWTAGFLATKVVKGLRLLACFVFLVAMMQMAGSKIATILINSSCIRY